MKAYQSTLFFLALLVVFTLLSRGSRALVEPQASPTCTHYFDLDMVEHPKIAHHSEGKYALDCKDTINNQVITRFQDLQHIEACVAAYKKESHKSHCWCRMY